MQKRKLGKSDLMVSEIGLGCMSLGTDPRRAEYVIDAAIDAGVNYFDTADLYDFGENEQIIGQALKRKRNDIILATKVGNRWNEEQTGWSWDPSKAYIKEQIKQSLKRLNTDYIDLYQLHGGTLGDPISETIEAFEELKDEGLIRYYGISSIRPNVIRIYSTKSNITSVMMQYSLLDRRPEEEALPLLEKHEIGVVCRGSVAKGILTEKQWEDFSQSVKENGYLDYTVSEIKQLISILKDKFSNHRTLNEIAIQYCLAHPAVTAVIAGASTAEQITHNSNAATASKLSTEELEFLKHVTKASTYPEHR